MPGKKHRPRGHIRELPSGRTLVDHRTRTVRPLRTSPDLHDVVELGERHLSEHQRRRHTAGLMSTSTASSCLESARSIGRRSSRRQRGNRRVLSQPAPHLKCQLLSGSRQDRLIGVNDAVSKTADWCNAPACASEKPRSGVARRVVVNSAASSEMYRYSTGWVS